ncbi:hypothetical protein RGCCGE502_34706 (plasmid) [Rhizobium grahamii CCGE 502]|uniref:Uncharacterized protein n=1 Tax=Rhizobium grahamii CCGE 502 TaxID=990285 RepID=S3I1G4_9HYPH|nr:hypothetical protein RGCCGE502_34706 [Rhizobium grahamii CCGE 502]
MFPAKLGDRDTTFRLAKDGKDWGSLNLLVFIKISSAIKPEKILLLKPVNSRGDYQPGRVLDAWAEPRSRRI